MHERRSGDPHGIAAAIALLDQNARHHAVVDGLLARHIARHELELGHLVGIALGGRRVNVNPVRSVFGFANRDALALSYAAPLANPQLTGGVQQQSRVHSRLCCWTPPVSCGFAKGAAYERASVSRLAKPKTERTGFTFTRRPPRACL